MSTGMIYIVIESLCQHEQSETVVCWREDEADANAIAAELTSEADEMFRRRDAWETADPEPDFPTDEWRAWSARATNAQPEFAAGMHRHLRMRMTLDREEVSYRVEGIPRDPSRNDA